MTLYQDNPEYDAFVDKFKQRKTTDDCYTPPEVYETIKNWVCEKYGINKIAIVRPFYPGGDFEHFEYPEGCVVLDNPPFSILSYICRFYLDREIRFFLFAPSLTVFSGESITSKINHIVCDCDIEYENGAIVRTSFVTNMDKGIVAQTSPELTKRVNATVEKIRKKKKKQLQKHKYPEHIVTAAMMQKYSKYGIDFIIRKEDSVFVAVLDAQKNEGKKIFGGGLLLSDRAAAEKAAIEKEITEKENQALCEWELSERELGIVRGLQGRNANNED